MTTFIRSPRLTRKPGLEKAIHKSCWAPACGSGAAAPLFQRWHDEVPERPKGGRFSCASELCSVSVPYSPGKANQFARLLLDIGIPLCVPVRGCQSHFGVDCCVDCFGLSCRSAARLVAAFFRTAACCSGISTFVYISRYSIRWKPSRKAFF